LPCIDLLFNRAVLSEQIDNLEQFEQDLRHILKINPQHVDALNALGYSLAEHTNRHQEAHHLLKQALDLQPESPYVLDSMGWLLYKMGKYQEAIEHLRKAQANINASIPPEVAAESNIHLGEVLWVSGDKKAAKKVWKKARQDFPENEKLREVMRRFLETPIPTSKDKIEK